MPAAARSAQGIVKPTNARGRGKDAAEWKTIPREVAKAVPPWPEGFEAEPQMLSKWDEMWHKPQANVWHEIGMYEQVAVYVQLLFNVAYNGMPPAPLIGQLNRMSDALLLTPAALRAQRYTIEASEDGNGIVQTLTLIANERAQRESRIKRAPIADES